MKIAIETEFSEIFSGFIQEQGELPCSRRISVGEAARYIHELLFLLPGNDLEAEAVIAALKLRGNTHITQLVKDGLA